MKYTGKFIFRKVLSILGSSWKNRYDLKLSEEAPTFSLKVYKGEDLPRLKEKLVSGITNVSYDSNLEVCGYLSEIQNNSDTDEIIKDLL